MDRKKFIRSCGLACAGIVGLLPVMDSCTTSKAVSGKINGDELEVPLSAFQTKNGNELYFKKYVIIENERLRYPICIYRIDEKEYHALWMRCTHQGTELQVFGARLQCPAHGSEFSHEGNVETGPAAEPLRKFPLIVSQDHLRLSLKAL